MLLPPESYPLLSPCSDFSFSEECAKRSDGDFDDGIGNEGRDCQEATDGVAAAFDTE